MQKLGCLVYFPQLWKIAIYVVVVSIVSVFVCFNKYIASIINISKFHLNLMLSSLTGNSAC